MRKQDPRNPAEPVETPGLGPDSSPDEVLDAAVEYTFPASDPIAVENAYRAALRRRQSNA